MPFIGKQPEVGAYQLIDSITTSATATYALTVNGSAYFPASARNLIVSLNGVTQAPESAYTVSGSNIVFDSALTASDVIDYILVIGDAVDIGTPSDGTVGTSQLASSIDLSGKTITFANDQISGDAISGGTATLDGLTVDTNTLVVDATNNRVGIGTTVPDRQLQVESTTAATFSLATTKNSNAGDAEYSFGEFDFLTNDSVGGVNTPVTAARIAARAKTDSSVPGGELAFYTNISGGSQTQTPFERMRIDSNGNVGIGSNDPECSLTTAVSTSTAYSTSLPTTGGNPNGTEVAYFENTDTSSTNFKYALQAFRVGAGTGQSNVFGRFGFARTGASAGAFVWQIRNLGGAGGTATQEALRLDSSGNLLVGKTVSGTSTEGVQLLPSGSIYGTRSGNVSAVFNRTTSTGHVVHLRYNNTTVGAIAVTATNTSYNTSSDQRLKENIVDAPAGNIDAIRVRSFDWKVDGSHQTYGMIAQELVEVAPEAVYQGDTDEDMWGVDYSKLVPMMIKEIQDLKAEVAALKGAN